MTAGQYGLAFTLFPFLFGAAAVWARRAGGVPALWSLWAAAALLFATLGYADWRTPPDNGTPLAAYLAFATVPTAVGALVASRLDRRRLPLLLDVAITGTATWITIFPVLLVFTTLMR